MSDAEFEEHLIKLVVADNGHVGVLMIFREARETRVLAVKKNAGPLGGEELATNLEIVAAGVRAGDLTNLNFLPRKR